MIIGINYCAKISCGYIDANLQYFELCLCDYNEFSLYLLRAEQEKKLAQQKKEEEERLRKEEADKKAKEAEEKRKRLEEAEKKRQAMMQAQKEKQQAAGQGAKGPKKTDSGVSTSLLQPQFILVGCDIHPLHGYIKEEHYYLVPTQTGHAIEINSGDRGGNGFETNNKPSPRQSPLQITPAWLHKGGTMLPSSYPNMSCNRNT